MAEDKAFPYSEWLAKIHPQYKIPLNMMLVVFVVEIAVGRSKHDSIRDKSGSLT